ncbi:phosphate/phosphite/phosphonate ABC transporter substrate-binding protein [Vibrio mangrovi]|uniref:Phosphate-import protein PhnD n=1 Tax=Vibrio mangrovi TaxID=474394 RepID=A0A1Y6IQT1_9VIBR|nr:phosphate/phosphite/phosphonate ABC transporter substrate-binding protein [Vibrio mangrovi]MDW6003217.1 phosphate/phosphite/phosphonate ABC transporter substrate-binding protein [Vibrio mangrovi]SMR99995.1 Phosphate-import protein PhnD precursor [Vibrio mangrovi]
MRTGFLFAVLLVFSTHVFPQTLSFGVVPQQSAKKMAALWSPVLQYISRASGLDIEFATAKDIPEFERRLRDGEYDIAYMNPYHYVVFHQKPGYQAIAKQKDKQIQGIIVVRKDSPIHSLEDLQDHQLAFPSPAAFAASILPRANLERKGINFTPKYVSSHDSVYLNVSRGFFPAGGGVLRTLNNTDPKVSQQLKILWTTPPYTSHAIAVHPRVSEEIRQKIVRAMLEMNNDEQGMTLLKGLSFKGLEAASDQQWDDIRELNIRLLDHLLE